MSFNSHFEPNRNHNGILTLSAIRTFAKKNRKVILIRFDWNWFLKCIYLECRIGGWLLSLIFFLYFILFFDKEIHRNDYHYSVVDTEWTKQKWNNNQKYFGKRRRINFPLDRILNGLNGFFLKKKERKKYPAPFQILNLNVYCVHFTLYTKADFQQDYLELHDRTVWTKELGE